ncbi:MAG: YcxB family protein [Fibromonadaceae bacterium]|jgi:hypothetical protein|nr:YcxB family protein [Fibromonadaceae bacterium]
MEYKLSGKVSLDDYIQFNKNHRKRGFSRIVRLVFYPLLIIFVVVSLIPLLEDFEYIYSVSPLELLKIFFPFILLIIFLIFYYTIGMRLICKKHFNSNKAMQQFQNIIINEQCISITSESGNGNLTKENINKIYYDKDSIYVYTALNIGYIIKKRFLENENDFEELVKFVKINFGKK